MAEMASINPYRYRLKNIELHETSLSRPEPSNEVTNNFSFNVSLETKVDQVNKVIIIRCDVKISPKDSVNILATISCICIFELLDFDKVITLNNGIPEIPVDLNATLNQITISTTRGVMFGVFKGTAAHFAFLPIIDVRSMEPVKQNV